MFRCEIHDVWYEERCDECEPAPIPGFSAFEIPLARPEGA